MSRSYFRTRKQVANKRNKGFTLLEIMIALTILAVGILAVGTLQVTSTNRNSSAGSMTEAKSWCTDQMEQLLAVPYANLTNSVIPFVPVQQDQRLYNVQWTVAWDTILPTLVPDAPVRTAYIQMTSAYQRFGITRNVELRYIR